MKMLQRDGAICHLCKNGKKISEWNGKIVKIINHSDRTNHLIFDEYLYDYSVLNLSNLKFMYYLQMKSYLWQEDRIQETFIWCDVHYDKYHNYLAVEGCIWAIPYSVIIIDFNNFMEFTSASKWFDIKKMIDSNYEKYDNIDVKEWTKAGIICIGEKLNEEIKITMLDLMNSIMFWY